MFSLTKGTRAQSRAKASQSLNQEIYKNSWASLWVVLQGPLSTNDKTKLQQGMEGLFAKFS